MYCTNCGTANLDTNKFCKNCAQPLIALSPAPVVSSNDHVDHNLNGPQGQQSPQGTSPPPQHTEYKPPKPKKSRKVLVIATVAVVAILVLAGVLAVFVLPNKDANDKAVVDNTPRIISTTSFSSVGSKVIGQSGGVLSIDSASSPLNGLKLEVPSAVAQEDIDFSVNYANITTVSGLLAGADVVSKMIQIETSGSSDWNQYKIFDGVINVTLPYDPSLVTSETCVRFYQYDAVNHSLASTGYAGQSTQNNTITFEASTFCDFVGIGLPMADLNDNRSPETGFVPGTDGWFIPNMGSYQTSSGNCLGMSTYASWYYSHEKSNGGLYSKYIEDKPADWRDDATAIQLATRAQIDTQQQLNSITSINSPWNQPSKEVSASIMHGLKVTGAPQLLLLREKLWYGGYSEVGHAVLVYQYASGSFSIYDPNAPNRTVSEAYSNSSGFSDYVSGTHKYNTFSFVGVESLITNSTFKDLYDDAQLKFRGDSKFPTVNLTDSTTNVMGTTPIDTNGDGVRDTNQRWATISGTITGGDPSKAKVTSTLVYINGKQYETTVTADGRFSQQVPLNQGNNSVGILATDNKFYKWAGYLRDTINCSALQADMTVTLTWDQDQSDVDLHVLEPTINGTDGRHIYYANKGYASGSPYLDMDNVVGYGPEHYYATENMTLPQTGNVGPNQPLYGTYLIRVHYYADHSGSYVTQPITWHLEIRYLIYKDPSTGQEYWGTETHKGNLLTASTYNTGDFYNTGSSWAQIYSFTYNEPVPPDQVA